MADIPADPDPADTPGQLVQVALQARAYPICITTGQWASFPTLIRQWLNQHPHWRTESPRALIVTDTHVADLFACQVQGDFLENGWKIDTLVIPAGEASKSLTQAALIYDRLVDFQADRKTVVIALGGGVIGDLAGFAAATYARGLPFVQIPTTLLADVDSSVGGKVGINHPRGKNLIGAFHQPLGVLIETDCLQSLPDRDYRSGLAEVVKYGVIMDAPFFDELAAHVDEINRRQPEMLRAMIARCCRLKADVVEEDEFERTGRRAILNYGHTFAHAYEALCGYGELTHGEAVAIGMMDAAILARELGRVTDDFVLRQHELLTKLHLPTELPREQRLPAQEYIACMRLDKKSVGGKLRFILPSRIGEVELVQDIPETLVQAVLEREALAM